MFLGNRSQRVLAFVLSGAAIVLVGCGSGRSRSDEGPGPQLQYPPTAEPASNACTEEVVNGLQPDLKPFEADATGAIAVAETQRGWRLRTHLGDKYEATYELRDRASGRYLNGSHGDNHTIDVDLESIGDQGAVIVLHVFEKRQAVDNRVRPDSHVNTSVVTLDRYGDAMYDREATWGPSSTRALGPDDATIQVACWPSPPDQYGTTVIDIWYRATNTHPNVTAVVGEVFGQAGTHPHSAPNVTGGATPPTGGYRAHDGWSVLGVTTDSAAIEPQAGVRLNFFIYGADGQSAAQAWRIVKGTGWPDNSTQPMVQSMGTTGIPDFSGPLAMSAAARQPGVPQRLAPLEITFRG